MWAESMVCGASSWYCPPPAQPIKQLRSRTSSNSIIGSKLLFCKATSPPLHLKLGHNFYANCCCKHSAEESEGFSVLESDIPWDSGSIWSSYAFYLLSFHVPLSFGGLSAVGHVLNQPILDPQTKALSLVLIQMLELCTVYWLLSQVVRPRYEPLSFFQVKNKSKSRNWVLASALGFGSLVVLVFFNLFLADQLPGTELAEASNRTVKEILSHGAISRISCILVYCIVTPLLEEIIYRGIILTSLASQMKWHQAVVISSAVFGAAHFAGENFPQLFTVGFVLGCSYCWSGKLVSPFVIHSLYNLLILINTYLS